MLGLPKLPPIPIPSNVVSQLQLGLDAMEMLRDIDAVISVTETVDGPWLPEGMAQDIRKLIEQADEVY